MRFSILLLFGLPCLLQADVIILRNGQSLEGRIQSQNRTSILLETSTGPRTIARQEVRRITFGAVDLQEAERKQELLRKQKAAEEEAAAAERRRIAEEEARREKEERVEWAGRNRGLLLRSLILPGWGHFAGGYTGTGAAYAGSAVLLAGATAALHARALESRSMYQAQVMRNNFLALGLGQGSSLAAVKESSLLYSFSLNRLARQEYARSVQNYNAVLGLDAAFYVVQLSHLAFQLYASEPSAGQLQLMLIPEAPLQKRDGGLAWQVAWTDRL